MASGGLLDDEIISIGVDARTETGSDIDHVDPDNVREPSPGDALLAQLGWTMADVEEFQTIWHTIKISNNDDMADLGTAVLIWLLEAIPDAKTMFQVYDIKDPRYNKRSSNGSTERFTRHAVNIGYELDKLVNSLSDPDLAFHYLTVLAQEHIGRKVQPYHYENLRDRFHRLLYDLNGYERDSRAADLWYQFLDAFVNLYKGELGIEPEEEKPKSSCCTVL